MDRPRVPAGTFTLFGWNTIRNVRSPQAISPAGSASGRPQFKSAVLPRSPNGGRLPRARSRLSATKVARA